MFAATQVTARPDLYDDRLATICEVTVIRWPSRDQRARVSAVVARRFSPQRWSLNDQIIAVAAVALAVSVFLPWYKAIVRIGNSSVNGILIRPRGTASGISVHEYLWAMFGLAALQFVLLVVRYAPGPGRTLTIPGYRPFLLITSVICFAVALTAFVLKPGAWYGNLSGGEITFSVGWDYGAVVAIIATLASVIVTWTLLRDPTRQ